MVGFEESFGVVFVVIELSLVVVGKKRRGGLNKEVCRSQGTATSWHQVTEVSVSPENQHLHNCKEHTERCLDLTRLI